MEMLGKLCGSAHRRPYRNIDVMLIGIGYLVSGVVAVLSLGFVLPAVHMDYVEWRTRQSIRYLREMEALRKR